MLINVLTVKPSPFSSNNKHTGAHTVQKGSTYKNISYSILQYLHRFFATPLFCTVAVSSRREVYSFEKKKRSLFFPLSFTSIYTEFTSYLQAVALLQRIAPQTDHGYHLLFFPLSGGCETSSKNAASICSRFEEDSRNVQKLDEVTARSIARPSLEAQGVVPILCPCCLGHGGDMCVALVIRGIVCLRRQLAKS